ncbi:MAG: hypothetical protein WC979_08035 [Candidatus Pacearchaeota archaeon]|jgi:hypothetical protein
MDTEVIKEVVNSYVLKVYNAAESYIPEKYRIFINLGFFIIFISLYAIFIWKFYRFLAKRDIFQLDLNKYNTTTHPVLDKVLEIFFFCLEFLIIFPLIIFFWFGVLALFLIFLSKSQSIDLIILIAAGIVGAIRLTAYISEDLSKDLAKMFPFTLLGIFLVDPSFFSLNDFIDKISQIPSFINNIFLYLIFIFFAEITIRLIFTIITSIRGGEPVKPAN